jgi:phosphatidylglycerophosphate synthase
VPLTPARSRTHSGSSDGPEQTRSPSVGIPGRLGTVHAAMSTISDSISELRNAQKSNQGAPAYSRFVNRPIGRLLAAVAHNMGLGPNAVTLISGAVTMSGVAVIALVEPTWWSSVLISFLLVLGYALDSADGQVARLQGRSSLEGEWLDHMMDALKLATIHTAVLVSWYRWFDLDEKWLLVPLLFQVVGSVFFFGVILTDLLRRLARLRAADGALPAAKPRSTSVLYSLAVIPADYGLICLIFLTLWLQTLFVAIYTALAVVNALVLAASGLRWFRAIRALA